MRICYLCDGNVEGCLKTSCYKFGGSCCHTENEDNAKNPPEDREFIKMGEFDKWEI